MTKNPCTDIIPMYLFLKIYIHMTFFKITKKKEFEFIRVSNSIYLRQTTDENSILFDYT